MRSVIHIEAPVEIVFDFFKDPRRLVDLNPIGTEVLDVKLTEQGTGTFTSYRTKMAGVPFELFTVYTDVVPGEHITEKSSSALVGTWKYSFEPEGSGTKVSLEHRSRSFWHLPPLGYLNDVVVARASASFLRRVKDRIESSRA